MRHHSRYIVKAGTRVWGYAFGDMITKIGHGALNQDPTHPLSAPIIPPVPYDSLPLPTVQQMEIYNGNLKVIAEYDKGFHYFSQSILEHRILGKLPC